VETTFSLKALKGEEKRNKPTKRHQDKEGLLGSTKGRRRDRKKENEGNGFLSEGKDWGPGSS